jgi:hypothetical protein
MNKIVAVGVIALLVNVAVVLIGFSYLQDEINQLKTESGSSLTPTPTSTPASVPEQTPSPEPTAEPLLHDYVVYEWHLKAEYINNVTWLNDNFGYDSGKTWSENYVAYINSRWAFPEQLRDSEMGVIAKAAFVRQVSVNASFNEATGFTKAIYQYAEIDSVPMYYVLESTLPIIADDRGWTKTFV